MKLELTESAISSLESGNTLSFSGAQNHRPEQVLEIPGKPEDTGRPTAYRKGKILPCNIHLPSITNLLPECSGAYAVPERCGK